MKRFLKLTRRSAQSGQAIILIALGMVGLLAFAALALDGGQFYNQRRTAQNASDMASLGGLYVYLNAFTTVLNDAVLLKIVQLAQANSIADTDTDPNNAINTNVEAWWLDINGNVILVNGQPAKIDNNPARPPAGANGIRVRTYIPYQTFIGGIIGQPTLIAQADGDAHIVWSGKPISGLSNESIWVGGGDCNTLTDRIAHNYSNTNGAEFYGSIYIDGSLAVGAVNSSRFHNYVTVRGLVGSSNGQIDGLPLVNGNPSTYVDVGTAVPFTNNNKFNLGAATAYKGETGSTLKGMSPWAYLTSTVISNGTFTPLATPRLLETGDFNPDPNNPGEMYKRDQYLYYPLGLTPAPTKFYHAIQGDNVTGRTAGAAANDITTLWNSGERGIFYVQGDMTVPDGGPDWTGVTLIVTGKFLNIAHNREFYSAGPAARNISVMAGADLGTPTNNNAERCASNKANWVFKEDGSNVQYHGVIYVPHGQVLIVGNTSNGTTHVSEAVVSYSLYLGSNNDGCLQPTQNGCEAQSWQFQFSANLMSDPFPALTLQH